jgi:hypothetical protein
MVKKTGSLRAWKCAESSSTKNGLKVESQREDEGGATGVTERVDGRPKKSQD